jgi:hypothetical protein
MRGCFTGEFGLGADFDIDEAPYVIARDRIIESRSNPFTRKLLPIGIDEATGARTAGGYYLLPTFDDADRMRQWYQDPVDGMIVDGIPMLQRTYFLEPRAHSWRVAGAEDFRPLASAQRIVRFERWRARAGAVAETVERLWPEVRARAVAAGVSAVWLLHNGNQDESVGLITVADRLPGVGTDAPDFASVRALAALPSLGAPFDALAYVERTFDRTGWIYCVWFPYHGWRTSRKLLWPNSPPFPGL